MKRAFASLLFLGACSREPDPTLARMMEQKRVDPFEQPMRSPPADTVPRDDDRDDEPPAVDATLLAAGRAHYVVACAACHGASGDGKSYAAGHMRLRPPPSLLEPRYDRERIYRVTTDGYGLMPSQAAQLDARARWAVAAYVEELPKAPRPGP